MYGLDLRSALLVRLPCEFAQKWRHDASVPARLRALHRGPINSEEWKILLSKERK
jgi:hypothetical protein